ncbi:hypothetical protein B0I35DRAFT_439499 [Stachybotrys elegans]|uniref:Uncharacterized protein n=1 Tax=Stachybotrys elegans TaxID=80388 RepID=A0A8K0SIQ9_9HYPO|nr:hypothetical protein B0I35DRAFT_439499 [Stachybotrys elegans]
MTADGFRSGAGPRRSAVFLSFFPSLLYCSIDGSYIRLGIVLTANRGKATWQGLKAVACLPNSAIGRYQSLFPNSLTGNLATFP